MEKILNNTDDGTSRIRSMIRENTGDESMWLELYEKLRHRTIRISGIEPESIVDGPGVRYTIFTQGCKHNCPGCHNPSTHDFNGGELVTLGAIVEDIVNNDSSMLTGITFSGGDPIEQVDAVHDLILLISLTFRKKFSIMLYTGYTYDELVARHVTNDSTGEEFHPIRHFLTNVDILVDGKYIEAKRDMTLKFRGSSNQRMLFLKCGEIDHESDE